MVANHRSIVRDQKYDWQPRLGSVEARARALSEPRPIAFPGDAEPN
jgi:hypothetical protein